MPSKIWWQLMTCAVYICTWHVYACLPRASRIIWMTTAHLGIMRWICIFVSLVAVAAECSRLGSAFVICFKSHLDSIGIILSTTPTAAASTGCYPIKNPNPHESPFLGISDRPENCHDRRTSVARWVTPYGREALWFSNNSVAIPLLTSEEALGGTPWAGRKSLRNSSGKSVESNKTQQRTCFFFLGSLWASLEEMRFLNILFDFGVR